MDSRLLEKERAENRRFCWSRPKQGLYNLCVTKNNDPSEQNIAIQSWLRPALTPVVRNVDYKRFTETLDTVSALLRESCLEAQAVDIALDNFGPADAPARAARAQFAIGSLRVAVLRHLLGMPSYRELAREICRSDQLADFCGLLHLDGIRGAAKSTLERRCRLFSPEQLRDMLGTLTAGCGNADLCGSLGLHDPVEMDVCLIDGTCLPANIHYPTDWVLLRDVCLTLLKAIRLIRNEGLKARMPAEPESFQTQMNRLCMEMTHARRKKDARATRKKILRRMKRWLRTVGEHTRRHRDKLEDQGDQTSLSPGQIARIIERIDHMSSQIGSVIHQAHERIIGGRPVKNKDKILSAHDSDVNVVVRGKAGREVEFGNTLLLSETAEGYVTDWWLYREQAPSESQQLRESLQRQSGLDLDPVSAVVTDRGFASEAVSRLLKRSSIYDATCPRSVDKLRERMKEPQFRDLQWRRASTEARIATIRNRWIGGGVRCRSYDKRALDVGWAVLAHNLWFVARKLAQQRNQGASIAA